MAQNALFISPQDKRLLSYVEGNYDTDQLATLIYDVQQMEILPLIGTGLYNELEDQITNGTLTSLNTTLLNLIIDALRNFVLSDVVLISTYKIRNKGLTTMDSTNSQHSDLAGIDRMSRNFKDKAQVFAEKVTRYLCANPSSYPLFRNPGSSLDTIVPKSNNFYTGFYLGGTNDYCSLDNPST